jgi:hypothetical protein
VKRTLLLAASGFLLGVLSLSLNVGREIQVAVGAGRGPLMMSGLGASEAVWGLPSTEVEDTRSDFYFRRVEGVESIVSIPLLAQGPFDIALRMDSTVRTRIDLVAPDSPSETTFIPSGKWGETVIASDLVLARPVFSLRFEDSPLVRRSDPENFRRYVDRFALRADRGFELPWSVRIAGGVLVSLFAVLGGVAVPGLAASMLVVFGPLVLGWLSFQDPIAVALGLPRLIGVVALGAALAGLLAHAFKNRLQLAAALAAVAGAMTFIFGGLSFLANHSPADLDIHIWRTLDLADVPWSYEAWLRYGSHYPTPSQVRGSATEALGEGPAIPYSPLPYVLFYGAHALGLDLHWSMNAIEALSLALLVPLVFSYARAASSEAGGLLAASLMALDLATVHHLGRAHSPAVVGGALGLAGLLAFGIALPRLKGTRSSLLAAWMLGLGALGYSSTPLFYALFGLAFLALLAFQPETRPWLPQALKALAAGGVIALVLFYGHYLNGLSSGGGSAMLSDPFPGRTFFIFHNESRQSLRLWRLGLFVPFLLALPACGLIATRCSGLVQSFLFAWLIAWGAMMALKEPWGFPVLLRWAKEDFYVAPALALTIAIAIARIESRVLRAGLTVATLLIAAFLRARDYGFHADTLRFLR